MAITVDFCFVFVSKQGKSNGKRPYPAAKYIRLHNDKYGMSKASESDLWTTQRMVWLDLSAVLLAMHPQQWCRLSCSQLLWKFLPPKYFDNISKCHLKENSRLPAALKACRIPFGKCSYRMGDDLRTTLCRVSSLAVIFSVYWKLEQHPKNCRSGNNVLGALVEEGIKAICTVPDLWFTWTSSTLQPGLATGMFRPCPLCLLEIIFFLLSQKKLCLEIWFLFPAKLSSFQ